jgi:hypothetical protein
MNQSSDALHPQPPTEWKFAYFASQRRNAIIQRLLLFFLVKKSNQKRQAKRKTPSFGGLSI